MSVDLPSRYTDLTRVGSGGMGDVYRATDTLLRREVAIKVMRPDRRSADDAARMLREARAAAALRHPNVVVVYDLGEVAGGFFLAMEYLRGAPLRDHVGKGDLTTRLAWLRQVASALAAAHTAGLVHRDVKPENVFVCDDGAAKVLDFGIAKRVGAMTDAADDAQAADAGVMSFETQAGTIVGTPMYMAPEQRTGLTTPLTDQFAWGVVLWEVTTGIHPLKSPGEAMLALDALPAAVSKVARRATRPDPRVRFADMNEALRALEGEEVADPAESPPSTAPMRRQANATPTSTSTSTSTPTSTSTSTPTSTSTSTSTPTSTSTSTSGSDGTLRSSTPRTESGETHRGHTLTSPPMGTAPPRPRRRRLVAALVAVGLATGAWGVARVSTTPTKKPTPPSTQCTFTMLEDTPIDVSAKLTWVAGAGSTHGIAIASVGFVDQGIRETRVLADKDGVTVRRPAQADGASPVGLDVRWIDGTPRAVVSVHPPQDMQAEIVSLKPFATDMLSDFQRVGGQMFCRPKGCTYAVADVAIAFARLDPAPAGTPADAKLVAVATTQEKDGSRAVRLFGAGYVGDAYFAGQPGHVLDVVTTAHDDGLAAVAFVYDGKVHVGRLGEDAPAVSFGDGVKKLALGVARGVVHTVFVDRAGLHLVRQATGAGPVETIARTDLTEPTALSLVVTGDHISLGIREGGRACFAAGTTAEALARTSTRVVDSQPRDGPWSAPGSTGTVIAWIEDGPVRVRRAVAMCP